MRWGESSGAPQIEFSESSGGSITKTHLVIILLNRAPTDGKHATDGVFDS